MTFRTELRGDLFQMRAPSSTPLLKPLAETIDRIRGHIHYRRIDFAANLVTRGHKRKLLGGAIMRGSGHYFHAAFVIILMIGGAVFPIAGANAQSGADRDMETALKLASLLRSARSVIASNQDLINDPSGGNKGLTGARVLEIATEAYLAANGTTPIYDGQDVREARLIEAQMSAINEVMAANQTTINQQDVGFKGFVPAVFGRLVNERFAELVGDEAVIKVTAPPELIRNRKARPDEWETAVIQKDLTAPDWPKGQVFAAEATYEGKTAYRVLVPEYYSEGCLSCHGEPKGEIDVTGYPKEGGKLGDLGGVISISLFH
jgi:hypothetical protein